MKNKVKDILILAVVSLVFACVFQCIAMNFFDIEIYNAHILDRILLVIAIMMFVGLHFIFGFKNMYDYIIKHRYKIGAILIIVLSLLSYSTFSTEFVERIASQGGGIYSNEYQYTNGMILAFWWNLKLIALLLVSFETCMLITNKNKYVSVIGSILISFSGAIQWWFMPEILIFGQLFIILVDKFLNTDKYRLKIITAALATLSIILYFSTSYISWMISFGYVFLALLIWTIIKNRKVYKVTLRDIIILIFVITTIIAFFIGQISASSTIEIIKNTNYIEDETSSGGGISYLFSYLYNFLLPFKFTENNLIYASFISLFPVPLIYSLVYLYKKGNHSGFLLPMILLNVFQTVFCVSGFPSVLSKFTLLNYVPVEKAAGSLALCSLYMLLYIITNIDEELFKFKHTMRITLLIMCLPIFIRYPGVFSAKGYMYLFCAILCMLTFLFLNHTDKKYKKVFLASILIFALIGGIAVNPITKATTSDKLTQINWIL